MLTEKQRNALLVTIHREIEEAATSAAEAPGAETVVLYYPPNAGLTPEETDALRALGLSAVQRAALRKVVANACAQPLFGLFSLLDGLRDPDDYDEFWGPLEFVRSGTGEILNEYWLDGYWLRRERRRDPGWRLDTYEG